MKPTGRMKYVSGVVSHNDFDTSDPNLGLSQGLVSIWENERRGFGYIVKRVCAFPNPHTIQESNLPFIVTTYGKRDLEALRAGGLAGSEMVEQILGMRPGILPAMNDRVIASYTPTLRMEGVVKTDALVVQGLSLGFDTNKGDISYYIELQEVRLDANETVLALLAESSMNVANLEF